MVVAAAAACVVGQDLFEEPFDNFTNEDLSSGAAEGAEAPGMCCRSPGNGCAARAGPQVQQYFIEKQFGGAFLRAFLRVFLAFLRAFLAFLWLFSDFFMINYFSIQYSNKGPVTKTTLERPPPQLQYRNTCDDFYCIGACVYIARTGACIRSIKGPLTKAIRNRQPQQYCFFFFFSKIATAKQLENSKAIFHSLKKGHISKEKA